MEFLTTGSSRTIMVRNLSIILKHTTARRFRVKSPIVQLVFGALRALGRDNIRNKHIDIIRHAFAENDRTAMIQHIGDAPISGHRMLVRENRIFGSAVRTRILIAVSLLEITYPREIARIVDAQLASVQRICNDLETDGLLASRIIGVQREVRLNPRYFASSELRAFLQKLQITAPDIVAEVAKLRRRPRRAGKAL